MNVAEYRLGLALITGSAIAWSTAGFFTRLLAALDGWTMLAWRGIFGTIGIAVVILAMERHNAWRVARTMAWPGWLYAIVSAVGMVLFVTSLRHTTVAHVAVIYATVPFIAAALGWLLMRERPSRNAVIASIAALAGVALMVGLGTEGGLFGDLLALAMTLCMAAMMVIARRFHDIPTMPAACLSALLSGLVCWPFGEPLAVSGYDLSILALFGLVNSAVGLALFTLGARLLPAIETALIGSLDAPLAPLWVWLAFGETPGMSTIAGGLIVFAAVAVHIVVEARKRQAVASPLDGEPGLVS
ncbi:DMT family transporter [Aminobacter sp. BE322]|uniref:DMT family transporter n=1 Tax=unclassified Aminobacter TaxID=2644704 RepID=UPI003D1C96D1